MKTVCVFIWCFLAVALAAQAGEDVEVAKHVAECKKEMGITESKNPELLLDDDVSDEQKPCLFFCVLKKHGMMNENGTFNKAGFLARASPSKKEVIGKAMEDCEKSIKPVDGCKMAGCLLTASQRKSDPNDEDDQ